MVDGEGRIIPGDMLLLLYTQDLMTQSWPTPPGVVSEVKCSQHLFDQVAQLGARPIMSPTGHTIIKQRMRE